MTLALLVMVGPGKLMVGPWALVGLGLVKPMDLYLLLFSELNDDFFSTYSYIRAM